MKGGARNGVSNNIQKTKDHGNLEMEISETGKQGQESETRGKQGQMERGQRWGREGTEVGQRRGLEV